MSALIDTLFRPFPFGNVTLPNRIVMAPMTRNRSPKGVPGEDVAAYYRRRAESGVGLIITEGTHPPHKAAQGYPAVPHFYGDEALAGWKRVADEVHAAGGFIIPQLWHCGSVRKKGGEPDPSVPPFSASEVIHPLHKGKGDPAHAMTKAEITEAVAAYAAAAKSAKDLGFDGVEIHGAHGYLIDQFFWTATNQRTDEYGGPLENRVRFACEIIAAVRAAVGPDFPVVFRFSQWKQGDYHYKIAKTPEELERFLTPLSKAGTDIFHASTRRFWEPEFEGSPLNLAGWAKKITGKPSITVGSVGLDSDFLGSFSGKGANPTGIDQLLERLARDEFDLVAVGRALLSDPAWAKKIHEGKESDITPFTPAALGELV